MEPLNPADPRTVGPYRLLARLGEGGMGQVYLARSPAGRPVAVKVIRPELAGDPEFRTRFGRELAAARAVAGPYTVPVLDAERHGPLPWLATAFVLGPSLAEAVREHGPLPEHSVRALGAGLARALLAIHAVGLIHRDLKPSNVLLAADGPRLIDFGIARALDSATLTRTGVALGSPGFMSPEQAAGNRSVPAGDVFSLGAVLLYAATGHGPFDGAAGPAALLYQAVHDAPDLSELPPRLLAVVGDCLAKEPGRRPTPEQLLALMGTVDPDAWLPVPVAASLARRAAAVMDMESPAQTAAHPPAGAAAIAAEQAAAPGGQGPADLWPLGVAPAAQAVPKPSRRVLLAGGGLAALAAAGGAGWALSRAGGHPAGAGPAGPPPAPASAEPTPSRPDGVPPQPLWTYSAQGRLNIAPVLTLDGMVLPQGDGLVALDAATGAERWSRPDVNATYLAVGSGHIFTNDTGSALLGFDSGSGRQVWKSQENPNIHILVYDRVLGADDRFVYLKALVDNPAVADAVDVVMALSIATQQQVWAAARNDAIVHPIIYTLTAGGTLFYYDELGNLTARSNTDGSPAWTSPGSASTGFALAGDDSRLYCLPKADELAALRLSDGKKLWTVPSGPGADRRFSPVLAQDGVVYGCDGRTSVSAWDASSGAPLWTCPLPLKPSESCAPVLVKETLFVPGASGEGVYAVDIKRARLRWTFDSGLHTPDEWYLSADGERCFAKYGPRIYALPPN